MINRITHGQPQTDETIYGLNQVQRSLNKKVEINGKERRLRDKQVQRLIQGHQNMLEIEINLYEKRDALNKKVVQLNRLEEDSVSYYRDQIEKSAAIQSRLKPALILMRQQQVQMIQNCFDVHKEYKGFKIGEEFQIQRVALVNNHSDYVMVTRETKEDQDNLLQTEVISELSESANKVESDINVFSDYMDQSNISQEDQKQKPPFAGLAASLNKNKFRNSSPKPRKNTIEDFENFQGANSNDIKQSTIEEGKKEKHLEEQLASFITLTASDINSAFNLTDSEHKKKVLYHKITGGIHGLCLAIQAMATILGVSLPHRLVLSVHGFKIQQKGCSKEFPLFIRLQDSQTNLENGIILLDRDVLFLLYINGYKINNREKRESILNFNEIFQLKKLGQLDFKPSSKINKQNQYDELQLTKDMNQIDEKKEEGSDEWLDLTAQSCEELLEQARRLDLSDIGL